VAQEQIEAMPLPGDLRRSARPDHLAVVLETRDGERGVLANREMPGHMAQQVRRTGRHTASESERGGVKRVTGSEPRSKRRSSSHLAPARLSLST